jgi:cysteine desulfuration protein SufE
MDIDAKQDALIEEFAGHQDWMETYDYLIGRGKALRVADASVRDPRNAIPGCQSSVWIRIARDGAVLRLAADSDSMITRGMLSLLLEIFDNQPAKAIAEAELRFLDATGLRAGLSPSRSNGLATIIRHIQTRALRESATA